MLGINKKTWLIGGSVVAVLVISVIVILILISSSDTSKKSKFVSNSPLGVYNKAAVSTNGPECAQIGADMLEKNGSAVDAAIAALLCEGISSLHSMGLGGGFFMTIYDATTGTADFLDARETAPAGANSTMFMGHPELSLTGGLAVAVPGELMGYWEAHQKYGRLPWKDLFEPTIKLCGIGTIVTKYHENSFKGQERYIKNEPTLREILINPETSKLLMEGDRVKRPKLAETLKLLSNSPDPVYEFYKGNMSKALVEEIRSFNGIITREDFANYRVDWKKPIEAKIRNLTMYTAPPPGSGVLLVFMMNILENLVPVKDEKVLWQRVVETFKWAYAKRTELGDPKFVPDLNELLSNLTSQEYADSVRQLIEDNKTYNDYEHYGVHFANKEDMGTSHVSILAPDGSAVSVTSTINQVLGAKFRSKSTGIIFNDEMDDFSSPNQTNGFDLPPSPNNYIEANKRPVSSMTPTIVLDENKKVQLVVGAAGGSKITTAVAAIMMLNLWNGYDIKEAIDAHRLHHQLFPMQVQNERGFPDDVLDYLRGIGHNVTSYTGIGSCITAVEKVGGKVMANSDYRREGKTAGF